MTPRATRFTREMIASDYRHRVARDTKTCPVCCGDKRTTDFKYAGKRLDVNAPTEVYECRACEVWSGPLRASDDAEVARVVRQHAETLREIHTHFFRGSLDGPKVDALDAILDALDHGDPRDDLGSMDALHDLLDAPEVDVVDGEARQAALDHIEEFLAESEVASGMDTGRVQDVLREAWDALGGVGDLDDIVRDHADMLREQDRRARPDEYEPA